MQWLTQKQTTNYEVERKKVLGLRTNLFLFSIQIKI